jgi:hypothetical protein
MFYEDLAVAVNSLKYLWETVKDLSKSESSLIESTVLRERAFRLQNFKCWISHKAVGVSHGEPMRLYCVIFIFHADPNKQIIKKIRFHPVKQNSEIHVIKRKNEFNARCLQEFKKNAVMPEF